MNPYVCLLALLSLCAVISAGACAAEPKTEAPVSLVATSYIGGAGAEYLSGGAFLNNGDILLAGTLLSDATAIAGVNVVVLGSDTLDQPDRQMAKQVEMAAMGWRDSSTTPFVVWSDSQLKEIKRVVRLPWQSGSVTDVLIVDDALYLAGRAGTGLNGLSVQDVSDVRDWGNEHAFVLRLDSHLSKVIWARTVVDVGKGPTLRLANDGSILLDAGWRYQFNTEGERIAVQAVRKLGAESPWVSAINPIDHTQTIGGYTTNGTGVHEGGGWWSPFLSLNHGTAISHRMFNFPEAICRNQDLQIKISSASRFIKLYNQDDGMLLAGAWAHGQNHMLLRNPFDYRAGSPVKIKNFYRHARGSSVFYHIMCVDPKTAQIRKHIRWTENHLLTLKPATDGSLVTVISGGNGDLLTGDGLTKGVAKYDTQVVIFNSDMNRVRMGTALPECGSIHLQIRDDDQSVAIATAQTHGRHRVLVMTGGREGAVVHGGVQATYGGGYYDGYVALLDIGPVATKAVKHD